MTLSDHEQRAFAQIEEQLRADGLDWGLIAADEAARSWTLGRGVKVGVLLALGLALMVTASAMPLSGDIVLTALGILMVFASSLYVVHRRPFAATAGWMRTKRRERGR